MAWSCDCGQLHGVVGDLRPQTANRVGCHCSSCVTWLETHERPGMLDELGASRVFQTAPGAFRITAGEEHLSCRTLTRKGALRWVASCCGTPLATTLRSPTVPFIGVYDVLIRPGDGVSLDEVLGPLQARVNGPYPARGAREVKGGFVDLFAMLLRLNWMMFGWMFSSEKRQNPLFDKGGQPIREPVPLET